MLLHQVCVLNSLQGLPRGKIEDIASPYQQPVDSALSTY